MNKTELLGGLQAEYQNWQALLDQIGPARMEQSGVAGGWSIKDIVAHITGWQQRLVDRLQAILHGEPEPPTRWPGHLKTDDAINDWIYQSRKDSSLRAVLDESEQVFQALLAAIRGLSEETLAGLPWQPFTAAEIFGHFHEEHEADMRAWLTHVEQQS